jgi:hypothetical protein
MRVSLHFQYISNENRGPEWQHLLVRVADELRVSLRRYQHLAPLVALGAANHGDLEALATALQEGQHAEYVWTLDTPSVTIPTLTEEATTELQINLLVNPLASLRFLGTVRNLVESQPTVLGLQEVRVQFAYAEAARDEMIEAEIDDMFNGVDTKIYREPAPAHSGGHKCG